MIPTALQGLYRQETVEHLHLEPGRPLLGHDLPHGRELGRGLDQAHPAGGPELDSPPEDFLQRVAALTFGMVGAGSIGADADDLDVCDSRTGGRLFAEADKNVFITEVNGALNVLAARALGGQLRLTVPDTIAADAENLVLLASGSARIVESAATPVSLGEITALSTVALWVGDNVTTDANSRIVAGTSIRMRDDTRRKGKTNDVDDSATVNVINRPHSITADVDIPASGAEGVLLAYGGNEGGYVFYVQEGKLHYTQDVVSANLLHVESLEGILPGRHLLRFEFEPTGKPDIKAGKGAAGCAQLYIDGRLVGQADFAATVPITYGLGGGISCGADAGSPVTDAYRPPFHFTGTIYEVAIDVSGELIQDDEAITRAILAKQ